MVQLVKIKDARYSFWRIFWIVIAVNTVLLLLSLGVILTTSVLGKPYDWSEIFSPANIGKQVIGMLSTTIFFYITLNHFNRLIQEKKKAIHYLPSVLLAIFVVACYHFITYYAFNVKIDNKMKEKLTTGVLVFSFGISAIFLTGLSLLIAYLNSLRDEQKQRKILEEQKMQLEVEKSQANLNFLKAQINPHFLHNTLNFLYAKALPLSEELSEGILTLSDIMRYALSEGNTKNGKSLLKEEIDHVQNVIKINQLRFSNNLKVNFLLEGVINGARIIPFVLITLVENAFKHGDLKNNNYPIDIRIHVHNNRLTFYCRNKKKSGSKELSTGLGLDNIKKRLELAYNNNWSFNIRDEIDFYTAELTIDPL